MSGYKMYGRLMTAVVIFHAVVDHIKKLKIPICRYCVKLYNPLSL